VPSGPAATTGETGFGAHPLAKPININDEYSNILFIFIAVLVGYVVFVNNATVIILFYLSFHLYFFCFFPKNIHFGKAHIMQLFAVFIGLAFEVLETFYKFTICFLQSILGVNIYKAGIIY